MNGAPRKTSPWVYVAMGCGAALLLAVLAGVGVAVLAYRKGQQIEAEMKDPAARAARVREVLGGDIPEGYYPVVAISVPFLMDMAMLGDHPPDQKGAPGTRMERGFIYVQTFSTGQQQDELKRYFEGKSDDAEALRRTNIQIEAEETIRRGRLELPGQDTLYLAQRGDVAMNHRRSHGLTTLFLIDCPQDERQRLGIWFGPDPAPGEAVESVDWSGSVADEAAATAFLGHFRFCGR